MSTSVPQPNCATDAMVTASRERCAALLRRVWAKADALLLNAATVPHANHMVFAQSNDAASRRSTDDAMTQGHGSRIFPGASSACAGHGADNASASAPPATSYVALVDACVSLSQACDASVGSLVGLALGDAFGAPLEFLPALENVVDDELAPASRPHLKRSMRKEGPCMAMVYVGEENKFQLKRGQWTDDAAMALCLADSLIVSARCSSAQRYDDGDCRMRYANWWFHGYNNCFRYDAQRTDRTSVGLGGNIAVSLYDVQSLLDARGNDAAMQRRGRKKAARCEPQQRDAALVGPLTLRQPPVPPPFLTGADVAAHPFEPSSRDSGNGSLMRLAPIPIRFHRDLHAAMGNAERSSYSTHAGDEAAVACAFVAYFVATAIRRWSTSGDDKDAAGLQQLSLCAFIDAVIAAFRADACRRGNDQDPAMVRLLALLRASPPSACEACWNWKQPQLRLEATLHARGSRYQGYPVSRGYFGSYALDGLAIALWAMYGNCSSFTDVLLRVVNVLGDADSTGAIACQMAGAFYGYRALSTESPLSTTMVRHLATWDPNHEIAVRGVLLHHLAECDATAEQGEGALPVGA